METSLIFTESFVGGVCVSGYVHRYFTFLRNKQRCFPSCPDGLKRLWDILVSAESLTGLPSTVTVANIAWTAAILGRSLAEDPFITETLFIT